MSTAELIAELREMARLGKDTIPRLELPESKEAMRKSVSLFIESAERLEQYAPGSKTKIVYTIAVSKTECHGHGDYSTEQKICRIGPYGTGQFPPVFTTCLAASKYQIDHKLLGETEVVNLDLIDE